MLGVLADLALIPLNCVDCDEPLLLWNGTMTLSRDAGRFDCGYEKCEVALCQTAFRFEAERHVFSSRLRSRVLDVRVSVVAYVDAAAVPFVACC